MRLASFSLKNAPLQGRVGVIVDDEVIDLTALAESSSPGRISPMRQLIASASMGDLDRARHERHQRFSLDQINLQPPVPDPSKIVAAPVNYVNHQQEMNESTHIDGLGVFLKAPSSLVSDGGRILLPYTDRRFDQEGELALIIKSRARNVHESEAMEYVFGYVPLLDMTMRGGEDRSTRKSFDTFTPMGPYLTTTDEVGDVGDLVLRCSVNGILRQQAQIADLIWSVPRLIAYVSSVMTLLPGDVISTGTPAGIGSVAQGDQIEVTIDRLGTLKVSVDASAAVVCPTKGAGRGPVPPAEVTPLTPGVTSLTEEISAREKTGQPTHVTS